LINIIIIIVIIRMIKSRKMRWTGLVVRMGEKRKAYRLFGGNARGNY
jgi:hypothetical protein